MKRIALSEIKDDLSHFLREAASQEIVITRHGKPAGVLTGFASEDDWLDYRMEHDPRFLQRITAARASIQAGRGVPLEDLDLMERGKKEPSQAPQRTGSRRAARARRQSLIARGVRKRRVSSAGR